MPLFEPPLIERDLGNYATAKKRMQKAIDIDEKKYEPGHPVLAIYYSHRGLIELNLGNYEVAKDLTQKAVNIYKQKFEHGHPRLGIFYRNLATIHLAIGKGNNEIACGLFKKAYQILYDANGKNHPKTKKCKEYLQEHCPGFFDQNE